MLQEFAAVLYLRRRRKHCRLRSLRSPNPPKSISASYLIKLLVYQRRKTGKDAKKPLDVKQMGPKRCGAREHKHRWPLHFLYGHPNKNNPFDMFSGDTCFTYITMLMPKSCIQQGIHFTVNVDRGVWCVTLTSTYDITTLIHIHPTSMAQPFVL